MNTSRIVLSTATLQGAQREGAYCARAAIRRGDTAIGMQDMSEGLEESYAATTARIPNEIRVCFEHGYKEYYRTRVMPLGGHTAPASDPFAGSSYDDC